MLLTTITRRVAVAGIAIMAFAAALPAGAAEVTVFAAASLKTALDRIAATWSTETGNTVSASYAGTPQLAKQIEAGAPADLFLSASKSWMDELSDKGLIVPDTRRDLLGNTLVLVASGKDAAPVKFENGVDLAGLLGDGKLAMAMVDSVPAGQYGKEALTSLGIWDAVAPKVAQSENVRAALALVAAGEAPYGIVYASDAVAEPGVTVVGTFPEDSHKPIVYPAALTASGTKPEAAAFLDYLSSDAAMSVFEGEGFIVLK